MKKTKKKNLETQKKKRRTSKKLIAPAKPKRQKRALALVLSGGGMRCAYSAGVLTALVEQYNLTEPDMVIAASGSAGNSAYYLAGQYSFAAAVWIQKLSGSHLISFKHWRFFNVDYLIDDVFKKQYPLNLKKLRARKTRWLVPVTRVRDGKTVFLRPERNQTVYEYLRAAKAIPFAYGKEVPIGKEKYIDGDFGSSFGDLVQKAIDEGATDILAVNCSPGADSSKRRKVLIEALYYEEKMSGNQGLMNAIEKELHPTPVPRVPGVRIVTLSMKQKGGSLLSTNKLTLRTVFNLGYADAVKNKDLAKLLQAYETTH